MRPCPHFSSPVHAYPRKSTAFPKAVLACGMLNQRFCGTILPKGSVTRMSSSDFKETVKQQADIVRIVGDYVKLPVGTQFPCPLPKRPVSSRT